MELGNWFSVGSLFPFLSSGITFLQKINLTHWLILAIDDNDKLMAHQSLNRLLGSLLVIRSKLILTIGWSVSSAHSCLSCFLSFSKIDWITLECYISTLWSMIHILIGPPTSIGVNFVHWYFFVCENYTFHPRLIKVIYPFSDQWFMLTPMHLYLTSMTNYHNNPFIRICFNTLGKRTHLEVWVPWFISMVYYAYVGPNI